MDETTLELFSEETNEILAELNENLIDLEKDPTNMELINTIFRHAHTLKGMSSALDFKLMVKLTHCMEDLMDKIRSKDILVTEEKIDTFLKCTDLLESICAEYLLDGNSNIDISEVVHSLELYSNSSTQPIENTISEEVNTKEVTYTNLNTNLPEGEYYQLNLDIDESVQIPHLRAYAFLNKLRSDNLYIASSPSIEDCKNSISFNYKLIINCIGSKETLEDRIKREFIFSNYSITHSSDINSKENESNKNTEVPTDKKTEKKQTIMRIQSDKMDAIVNLVAELVIEKNTIGLLASNLKSDILTESVEKIDRITNHLQGIVMSARMMPISSTFKIFPKEIRKVSKELNKKVKLSIEGEDTELDRSIVEHIKDPLVHIIRNSLDHGLETTEERIKQGKSEEGTLKISACYEGNQVTIEVSDDGKGIDGEFIAKKAIEKNLITEEQASTLSVKEKVNLICAPGFSTAEKVTNLSGRGVGLDAVKKFIEEINGTLEIDTTPKEGTTIKLQLPLTLGIIQGMIVQSGEERFAIPLADIETIIDIEQSEIRTSNGNELLIYQEKTYPLCHLSTAMELELDTSKENFAILIKKGSKNYALMVDDIVNQQEIVIKSLGETLKHEKRFSGATILGDGVVCLIIDSNYLQ